ncbi:MAG TPA: hypothetical protein VM121_03655, partial [Acidimicrobiales bacterium]|nr:hypothetical protein [Acidimicrobiales bacterium]
MTPSGHHIEPLLAAVWSMNGTDLLLTAGSAPLVRVDGALRPLPGTNVLGAPDVDRLVNGVLGRELSAQLPQRKQIDFAFTWASKARVR